VGARKTLNLLGGRVREGHLHLTVDEHERQNLAAVHLNLLGDRCALFKCGRVGVGGVHLNVHARIQRLLRGAQELRALHILRILRVLAGARNKYFKNGLSRFSHQFQPFLSYGHRLGGGVPVLH
jgi:hypothetical protein